MTMGISWLRLILGFRVQGLGFREDREASLFLFHDFGGGVFAQDFVAEAVFDGGGGVEEAVALGIFADAVGGLARALGEDVDQGVLGLKDFLGLDLDVGGLAVDPAEGLVDHDLGVGEDVAFALLAGGEDDGAAGLGAADAVGGDVAGEKLHDVVHGQRVIDDPAGAVDVEVDVGVFLDAL